MLIHCSEWGVPGADGRGVVEFVIASNGQAQSGREIVFKA